MNRCWKTRCILAFFCTVFSCMVAGYLWQFHRVQMREIVLDWRRERLRKALQQGNPRWSGRRKFNADAGPWSSSGFSGWSIRRVLIISPHIDDIRPLAGLDLRMVGLSQTKVQSLKPLRGMPIESLALTGSSVRDLAPLQGMPLEYLNISHTRIEDISPLRDAPLTELRMDHTPVTDLSPLAGAPLRRLYIGHTRIRDLTPLKGAPLCVLYMYNTPAAERPLPAWLQKRVARGVCFVDRTPGL